MKRILTLLLAAVLLLTLLPSCGNSSAPPPAEEDTESETVRELETEAETLTPYDPNRLKLPTKINHIRNAFFTKTNSRGPYSGTSNSDSTGLLYGGLPPVSSVPYYEHTYLFTNAQTEIRFDPTENYEYFMTYFCNEDGEERLLICIDDYVPLMISCSLEVGGAHTFLQMIMDGEYIPMQIVDVGNIHYMDSLGIRNCFYPLDTKSEQGPVYRSTSPGELRQELKGDTCLLYSSEGSLRVWNGAATQEQKAVHEMFLAKADRFSMKY